MANVHPDHVCGAISKQTVKVVAEEVDHLAGAAARGETVGLWISCDRASSPR